MTPVKRLFLSGSIALVLLAGVIGYFRIAEPDQLWFEDRIGGPPGSSSPQPGHVNVKVMAHYMPWFERELNSSGETTWQHWQWFGEGQTHDPKKILENGRNDIATVHYPLIGPYHSLDPDVIEYHILTAKLIGIEAFMCNWYGPDHYTDRVVAMMLPIAEKLDFKIGICVEEKAFFPPYSQAGSREELVAEMARHLNHIVDRYGDSAAFLKHRSDGHANGAEMPLLFLFNFYGEGTLGSNLLSAEEILAAREKAEQPLMLIRNDLNKSMFPGADGAYVWCAQKKIRDQVYEKVNWIMESAPSLIYRSAVVSPGFDDSGVNGWGNGTRQGDRSGTDEFLDNWVEAIASGYESIQIVTWNDFQEGTNIEPAVEYGFEFVDLAEQQVGEYCGRPVVVSDNDLGLEVYNLRIAVRQLSDDQLRKRLDREVDLVVRKLFSVREAKLRERIQEIEKMIESQ